MYKLLIQNGKELVPMKCANCGNSLNERSYKYYCNLYNSQENSPERSNQNRLRSGNRRREEDNQRRMEEMESLRRREELLRKREEIDEELRKEERKARSLRSS